jgi:halocyanin-like protein
VESTGTRTESDSPPDLGTVSAETYPLVERWLGSDEVGGVDGTYDGTLVDARGIDNPEVVVGAEGNGGPVAFNPSAVLVSPGAVVVWGWTAHGHYNVVSDPDAQLGESATTFSSGALVERETNMFSQRFDQAGTVLYHCEPHLDLGMKAAVVVAEGPPGES